MLIMPLFQCFRKIVEQTVLVGYEGRSERPASRFEGQPPLSPLQGAVAGQIEVVA
jgi:hypothetical protein